MVHVLAAHGPESRDDESGGTPGLGRPAAWPGAHYRLRHFGRGIIHALGDVANEAARARDFIDGLASASSQPAQRSAIGTEGIANGRSSAAAGSIRDPALVAKRSIRSHGRAVKPGFVVELACLHVEGNGNESGITLRIARRAPAPPAAEVGCDAVIGQNEDRPSAAITVVAVAILACRQSKKSNYQKARTANHNSPRFPALLLSPT